MQRKVTRMDRVRSVDGQEIARQLRQARIEDLKEILVNDIFVDQECAKMPILLEIGCGHGHWLNLFSEQNPEYLCIGIDIMNKRVKKSCSKRDKRGLKNLFFYKAELTEFVDAFSTIGFYVDFIVFLFPDPWPKKRHFKNRMIQVPTMSDLRKIAKMDSRFCFRTDHKDYFDWTYQIVKKHPDWFLLEDTEDWPHESPTFFQELMGSYKSLVAKPMEPLDG